MTLQTVEASVTGRATHVLGNKIWSKPDDIFEKLRAVYGINYGSANHLQSLKQHPEESARIFMGRVEYAVNLLKIDQTSEYAEHLQLSTFVNGLRSEITRKVNIFNLITVSDAVKAAERFDYVVTPEYANRLY